jgi:hypothetical protein
MLPDNIVTVLVNFVTYFMLHPQFREDLIFAGTTVADALVTDLASPELAYPPLGDLTVPE